MVDWEPYSDQAEGRDQDPHYICNGVPTCHLVCLSGVLCQQVPWPCHVQLLSPGGGCPSATPPRPPPPTHTGDLDPSVWVPSSHSHLTV